MDYNFDDYTNIYPKVSHDPTLLNLFVPNIHENTQLNSTKDFSQNDYVSELRKNLKEIAVDSEKEQTLTALVPTKQYSLINPLVVYKVKKSIKLSIRSFLISLSLTFLNFFI